MGPFPGVGDRFGDFEIQELLGRGAMGVVYRARQVRLGRDVALKLVAVVPGGTDEFRLRFQREAALQAGLDSPHVVTIYDHGEVGSVQYIVSQLVAGGDLARHLSTRGAMAVGDAMTLVDQVAQGLEAAHHSGVVHRDVKPANVLLRSGSVLHAYLSDFGVAHVADSTLTRSGDVVGTIGYLSPEQCRGEAASTASDQYALGCLLVAALTGRAPYVGSELAVMRQHVEADVPRLGLSGPVGAAIDDVLARMCAKDPRQRFADVGQARRALAQARAVEGRGGWTVARQHPLVAAPEPDATSLRSPDRTSPQPTRPESVPVRPAAGPRRGLLAGLAVLVAMVVAVAATLVSVRLLADATPTAAGTTPTTSPTSAPAQTPTPTPTPTPTATPTAQVPAAPAPTAVRDDSDVGYPQEDLGCTGEYVVVLTSEEGPSPRRTARDALDRFPRAAGRAYLDPAGSCSNLSSMTSKVNLTLVPYLGPFTSAVDACEARMRYLDTTTYVVALDESATSATYCACAYDIDDLPALEESTGAPVGDARFWNLELQSMLRTAGYGSGQPPDERYGFVTADEVAILQSDEGLDPDGRVDGATWAALITRAC